jgi:hypothetical protein
MAITFKKVATVAAELPATILSGLSKVLFGYTTADGTEKMGLVPYLFQGINYVMRGISNAIAKHKLPITIAFWSSLILASAVALTLFLWPAALAAVAGFSIGGLSIAGLVGTGVLSQVGLIAGLTFIATSTLTYIGAAITNGIMALVRRFSPAKAAVGATHTADEPATTVGNPDQETENASPLSGLGDNPEASADATETATIVADQPPVHHANLFATKEEPTDALTDDEVPTLATGAV